jgi:hypothetical protein
MLVHMCAPVRAPVQESITERMERSVQSTSAPCAQFGCTRIWSLVMLGQEPNGQTTSSVWRRLGTGRGRVPGRQHLPAGGRRRRCRRGGGRGGGGDGGHGGRDRRGAHGGGAALPGRRRRRRRRLLSAAAAF